MQRWKHRAKKQTLETEVEQTDGISMQVPPVVRAKLRALGQFSGHDNPAMMVSVCISFTHALMRLVEGAEGIIVTTETLKQALANVELVGSTPEEVTNVDIH